MRFKRFFYFIVFILVGAGIGVAYGWVINPPAYRDLPLDTLRIDYKADYVLMTAEVFRQDNNLGAAVKRLALADQRAPAVVVAEALIAARDLKYSQADLQTLAYLAEALHANPDLTVTPAGKTP